MAVEGATDYLLRLHATMNDILKERDPLILVAGAFAAGYTICYLWDLHSDDQGIRKRLKRFIFYYSKKIPAVRRLIEKELSGVRKDVFDAIHKTDRTGLFFDHIPNKGMSVKELIEVADKYEEMEGPNYLMGRVSGAVFNDEKDMDEMKVYKEVFARFAWSNPLWPKLFPGVRKMEAEVVRMCCNLMNGDEETCGTMSTGGTLSILLACLAHRNRALQRGVRHPEMVIPSSAHAAFTKAAEIYRMKAVLIPVDPHTFKVDLRKMRRAINSSTCMLVGSTPNFPFGSFDDIESIGELGVEYDIPVHVDACLGGFLLPFLEDIPLYDFRVPGVCSITADTHKYGLAPKGSSVVLYRNKEYLHNQYFCDPDWQGGIYASSTLEGSRSGSNIALCWASLLFQGSEKYRANARRIRDACIKIRDGIASISELRVQGSSDICIVSWTSASDLVDINRFHAIMDEKQWQLGNLQFPSGVHIMVTMLHTQEGVAEALIASARETVEEIKRNPMTKLTGPAAIYGMAQKIPDRSIVHQFAHAYLDACYSRPLVKNGSV